MNKKGLFGFLKAMLFLAGIGLIVGMYFAFKPADGKVTANYNFMWINIGVLYLVFFVPFFFTSVTVKNLDSKVPLLVATWPQILAFESVGIALTIAVMKAPNFHFKWAIVIESIMFFVLLIWAFFGLVGSVHVGEVAAREKKMMSPIKTLRSTAEFLAMKADSIMATNEAEVKQIKELSENLRFLTPVEDNEMAALIEQKLFAEISQIDSEIDSVKNGSDSANLRNHISNAQLLFKQRKMILN